MDKKVIGAIIASGGGSTADALMTAWRAGFMPDYDIKLLISTKKGAGCLEKAQKNRVESATIEVTNGLDDWNRRIQEAMHDCHIDLLTLAGCVKEVYPISGVAAYNTHPADPFWHGGRKMYGEAVHEHVLRGTVDQIKREMLHVKDAKTCITFHEVIKEIDKGDPLVKVYVKIPVRILEALLAKKISFKKAAGLLQKHVLQYEYKILPTAVNLAVQRLLDERR